MVLMIEQRKHPRFSIQQPVEVTPLSSDGIPQHNRPVRGQCLNVAVTGMRLEVDQKIQDPWNEVLIRILRNSQNSEFIGLRVIHQTNTRHGHHVFGGCLDNVGNGLFDAAAVLPKFDPQTKRITPPWPENLLHAWCKIGVLTSIHLDRVTLCPRCGGLPTFRQGCRRCGSGRTESRQLIHHYGCAHVAPSNMFNTKEAKGLMCPKCRACNLVAGSDFEYFTVEHCIDCVWEESELVPIGHCLACDYRFNAHEAQQQNVTGYKHHVDRLRPMDLRTKSR